MRTCRHIINAAITIRFNKLHFAHAVVYVKVFVNGACRLLFILTYDVFHLLII